mmetsp:Transcript_75975/g.246607  ORF Transcript_75975/g.246607 Transcript_75975/m.246607 type:complete len:246 (+) Transcript_75975:1010-1747(+)
MVPIGRSEVEAPLANLANHLAVGVGVERRVATKHDVGDHASGPNIYALVVAPEENLWRDVVRRTAFGAHRHAPLEFPGHAKVDEFQRGAGFGALEQKVLRLDVSVREAIRMQIGQRCQDLAHVHQTLNLAKAFRGTPHDVLEKLAPCAHLHHEVEAVGLPENFVEPYHIGVVQLPRDADLCLEPLGVPDLVKADALDRALRPGLPASHQVGRAIGSGTQGGMQLVEVGELSGVLPREGMLEVEWP